MPHHFPFLRCILTEAKSRKIPLDFSGDWGIPKMHRFCGQSGTVCKHIPLLARISEDGDLEAKEGVGRTTPPSFYTFVSAKNQLIADNLTHRLCNAVHCRCPFHRELSLHFFIDPHFFLHVGNQFLRPPFRCFLDFFMVI